MAVEFTMPKLGLTMTDGTIREWLVPDGTMVHTGDAVLVIETDKVETEVEARESGILSITSTVGETYECGDVIGHLLTAGEAPLATTAVAAATMAPSATRGEGGRILASPMARAAARKVGIELTAVVGTGPSGRIVADDIIARAEALAELPPAAVPPPEVPAAAAPSTEARSRTLASPMARAAARDHDVDLASVAGTGPEGRIVADDVTSHAETAAALTQTPAPAQPPAPTSGSRATSGGRMLAELLGVDLRLVTAASSGARITRDDVAAWVRKQLAEPESTPPPTAAPEVIAPTAPLLQTPSTVVPMSGIRAIIAKRMHGSLAEMAQLTLSVDADMTEVNAERNRLSAADLPSPGYTAWVIAAASRALVDHPYVNSQVTVDGIAHLPQVHIGVAVALDAGLIVPVINNTNDCTVDELHRTVADLASRARDGKLTLTELEGGTFSVTALGMYGVDVFTPVINPPNTAILGIGRLRTETRWVDGVPSPTTVMTLSLTWDHRAFDGAPAAEFAQSIVQYLENPAQLSG